MILLLAMTMYSPAIADDFIERGRKAQTSVKNLLSTHGGTVDEYLNEKAKVPVVEDLGWHTYPLNDGGFQVERLLLLNGTTKLSYRWSVESDGRITPENGKAISITKRCD
ncbi:hypothetical protein [Desulfococcus multivorans]|nr:hypothetical protein [Desulfococcus multivorans]AOY57303.1 uncharacterized protein Dmul_05280 [Desulfococcus multivorans]